MTDKYFYMKRMFALLVAMSLMLAGQAQAQALGEYHAKLVRVDAPDYMIGGEEYSIHLTYKNAGTRDWTRDDGITLGWASPALSEDWGSLVVGDLFDAPVAPGDSVDIDFKVVAPMLARSFDLAWQLYTPELKPFGELAEVSAVRVETAKNQARVVMQMVPDEVAPGAEFTALFQVKNIGRTTWDRAQDYHLAMISAGPWSRIRLDLAEGTYVTPGELATFKARFKAPMAAGTYPFEWRMQYGDIDFGEPSAPVLIKVGSHPPERIQHQAEFVFQDVPEAMLGGDFYTITVQYKNTGKYTWRSGEVVLSSPKGKGMLWAVDEVAMQEGEVLPGYFASFRFTVQAPMEAGVYAMQWQLRHIHQGNFGPLTPRRLIDVR